MNKKDPLTATQALQNLTKWASQYVETQKEPEPLDPMDMTVRELVQEVTKLRDIIHKGRINPVVIEIEEIDKGSVLIDIKGTLHGDGKRYIGLGDTLNVSFEKTLLK